MTTSPVTLPRPTHRGSTAVTGLAIAVASALAFSSSGPFVKPLLDGGWSLGAVLLVRMGLAALLLSPALILAIRRQRGFLRRHGLLIVAFGLTAVAGCQLFYFAAMQRMPVAVALLIQYIAPCSSSSRSGCAPDAPRRRRCSSAPSSRWPVSCSSSTSAGALRPSRHDFRAVRGGLRRGLLRHRRARGRRPAPARPRRGRFAHRNPAHGRAGGHGGPALRRPLDHRVARGTRAPRHPAAAVGGRRGDHRRLRARGDRGAAHRLAARIVRGTQRGAVRARVRVAAARRDAGAGPVRGRRVDPRGRGARADGCREPDEQSTETASIPVVPAP